MHNIQLSVVSEDLIGDVLCDALVVVNQRIILSCGTAAPPLFP